MHKGVGETPTELLERARENKVAWLFHYMPKRLISGPFLAKDIDLFTLCEVHGVTHIVNILPETGEKTAKAKLNKDSWYEYFLTNVHFFHSARARPTIMRNITLPTDLKTQNQDKQVKSYIQLARELAACMKEAEGSVFYVHARTGFDAEAMLCLLTWRLVDPASFPPAPLTNWFAAQHYDRILDDEMERVTLQMALDQIAHDERELKKGSIMTTWLKKQKI
jgi:hypothetical protein